MRPSPAPVASYRHRPDVGPDPVTEADVTADLIHRATALRRRLLAITVGASLVAGLVGVAVVAGAPRHGLGSAYLVVANRILRSGGVVFATCAILTFVVLRFASERVARAREAAWVAELSRRYSLQPRALAEALAMFRV